MTDLNDFLNDTVPDILRRAQTVYNFAVVGGRAISMYADAYSSGIQDWDILFIGEPEIHKFFSKALMDELSSLGYKTTLTTHVQETPDTDVFNYKGRDWSEVCIHIGSLKVAVFEIFQIKHLNTDLYVIKDGIVYSDLGFLLREIDRHEDSVKTILENASKLTPQDIKEQLEQTETSLGENERDIDMIDNDLSELENDMEHDLAIQLAEDLKVAKNTLIKIINNRDILFGVVLSGKIDKKTLQDVCLFCKGVEDQYGRWKSLNDKCEMIKPLCM